MSDYTDAFSHQMGEIERICTNRRLFVPNGMGIYMRADVRDATEENLAFEVEEFGKIFSQFKRQFGLTQSEGYLNYYLYNFPKKFQILEMASMQMGEDPFSITPHFLVNLKRAGQSIPIVMVRMEDHLGVRGRPNGLLVWGYDQDTETFTKQREGESRIPARQIYKAYTAMLRGESTDVDPFIEIAGSIYTL